MIEFVDFEITPHGVLALPHSFAIEGGELVHYIDRKERARVPPEGWDDYVAAWPKAAHWVAQLRAPAPAAPVSDAAPIARSAGTKKRPAPRSKATRRKSSRA